MPGETGQGGWGGDWESSGQPLLLWGEDQGHVQRGVHAAAGLLPAH